MPSTRAPRINVFAFCTKSAASVSDNRGGNRTLLSGVAVAGMAELVVLPGISGASLLKAQ